MRIISSQKRGFTLIEVVIVVAVIGILAAVVLASVGEARKKARDTQRKSDLQQIQLALRLYKDTNGTYPPSGCGNGAGIFVNNGNYKWASPGLGTVSNYVECENYISGLVPGYIAALPKDPNKENVDNLGFSYMTSVDKSEYKLLVYGTVESKRPVRGDQFARCDVSCPARVDTWCFAVPSYAVYSNTANAPCW